MLLFLLFILLVFRTSQIS